MTTTKSSRDDSRPSVASVPLTQRHRRVARAFNIGIVGAAAGIALVGLVPLPRSDGFVPAVQAIIATAHFITAVLLFAQYAAERSRALLLLAGGYLFTALIVVAHALTFPGAFTPTGLFGAGQQTAAWLYLPWHVGRAGGGARLCVAAIAADRDGRNPRYACYRDHTHGARSRSGCLRPHVGGDRRAGFASDSRH